MSIYTNNSTNLAHGVETRDLLFTLSNGMSIHSVDDGYGRQKFWFSTSNDPGEPEFDIRYYMADAQEFYYTSYDRVASDPKSYENIWHNRVKECLENAFVPFVSSLKSDDGFIISSITMVENSLPFGGFPADWYLAESWKILCEKSSINSNNVCVLPTGQFWVSQTAMNIARKISLNALKEIKTSKN